jgi:uncharacterized repeat protein (TIGR01451 family)
VTNSVTVSGGGDVNTANNSSSDFTTLFTPNQVAKAWQQLKNPAPILNPAIHGLLLTDGSVMVQELCSNIWHRLIPDALGSYVNGTWAPMASMQPGYRPAFYSSAVLADGRVIVIGGEYNNTANCTDPVNAVNTNLGAIYDPRADTWTPLAGPPGWSKIGDAPNVVLPDGSFLLANIFNTEVAKLDPGIMNWTVLKNTHKADPSFEEGWTLLPDGTVLTVDIANGTQSETFDPATNTWTPAGSTVVPLVSGSEIGGGVLRPDGTVFVTGETGHTSIYDYRTRKWSAGPDFPVLGGTQLDAGDWPGALLPNGNVLVSANTDFLDRAFFEFDGKRLNPVPAAYAQDLLLLPTGQVLNTSGIMGIYTPSGNPDPAWLPTAISAPSTVQYGQTYTITGTQFNGLSQGVNYGDEAQAATNYPLVRITNSATQHVFYCRTHNHSTMGVATGATPVSTQFDVPQAIESGPSILEVVANGIASIPKAVLVEPSPVLTIRMGHTGNFVQGQTAAAYSVSVQNTGAAATSGTVSVTDTLPAGLTGRAIEGPGWACTLATLTCSRSDALAAGGTHPPVTVTVTVATGVASPLINQVSASGGGSATATASDSTTIIPAFTDVLASDSFTPFIDLLKEYDITHACQDLPLKYCPDDNIPESQMAVFVIRSVNGNDNFAYTPTPYFTDVPATNQYFPWIQKMQDLGIALPCAQTLYCPDSAVTRGIMSVLIIRSRFGVSIPTNYPTTPYFTDVPASHPYFPWIQKMKQLGITTGCTPTTYCPDDPVTRGQMAVFIMRGEFNQGLQDPNTPVLVWASPASASPGQTVTVTIAGQNTNFSGVSQVNAGPGVTVGNISVTNGTALTVQLTVASNAALGPRSITVTTVSEEATFPNGFHVQ